MSTSPIPPDLNTCLPDPTTPWKVSDHLFQRLQSTSSSLPYKKCEVLPSDPEWKFVYRYFHAHKPTNRSIKVIWCIHNPSTSQQFEGKIYAMEAEATKPIFKPKWDQEPQAALRKRVIDRWKQMCAPFSSFSVPQHSRSDQITHVRILPMWHGSNLAKCDSVCSSGLTFFGKHDLKHKTGGAGLSTDMGYFGSGIYFTPNARYAADVYSNGHMLLSWVSMREPYPVVADGTKLGKSSDMKKLEGDGGAYQSYNAHFIPVVPATPGSPVYYPCPSNQTTSVDELVVFNNSQTLTRFWIEMEIDLPKAPSNFDALFLQKLVETIKSGEVRVHPKLITFVEEKQSASSSSSPEEKGFYRWAEQFFDSNGNLDEAKLKAFLASTYHDPSVVSILKLQEHYLSDPDIKKLLTTYIAPQGSYINRSEATFPLEAKVMEFLSSDKKVLLLLGGSGAGKTTFLLYLTHQLWSTWKPEDPICLYVDPSAAKHSIEENLIKTHGFSPEQTTQFKKEGRPIVLFFDGYDEIGEEKNLYQEHHLADWNAHVIITCRTQYLSDTDPTLFAPLRKNDTPERGQFEELYVAPFTDKEIDAYLQQFLKQAISPVWTDYRDYRKYIDQIPGLRELVSAPFLLHLIAEVLPDIVEAHQKKHSEENPKLLKVDLYDAFMENWFDRAVVRLRRSGQKVSGFKRDLQDYCKELAREMHAKKIVVVDYFPPGFKGESPWERFFVGKVSHLRDAAPLKRVGENGYSFLHKSLLEYFAFRADLEVLEKYKPASKDKESLSLPENFTKRLLTEEPALIHFYVDALSKNLSLKRVFFDIIEASKTDLLKAIAASNSITILNVARVPFSRRDFRGIRVPNAYLHGAIFDDARLDGADLTNVVLKDAFLRDCTLRGAKMQGARFGEKASLIHLSGVNCIAVSPNNQLLATGSKDKVVRLWDLNTGFVVAALKGHTSGVTSIAFSPDGRQIASSSGEAFIRLWDVTTRKEIPVHKEMQQSEVKRDELNEGDESWSWSSVSFSPDGESLACISEGNQFVTLWNMRTHQLRQIKAKMTSAIFSPDGKWLTTVDTNKVLRFWDVETLKPVLAAQRRGFRSWQFTRKFSDYNPLFQNENRAKIQRLNKELKNLGHSIANHSARQKIISQLPPYRMTISSIAFSPNSRYLACSLERKEYSRRRVVKTDSLISVLDLTVKKEIASFAQPTDCITVAFSPNNRQFATAHEDLVIRLWNLENGREEAAFKRHTSMVSSISFSPDGMFLYSGSNDGSVNTYGVNFENLGEDHGHTRKVTSTAFSEDGKLLVSASSDRSIRFWDLQSGKHLYTMEKIGKALGVADRKMCIDLSPNGKLLAVAGHTLKCGFGHGVCLLDVSQKFNSKSFKTLYVDVALSYYGNKVLDVAFSPDGKLLAAHCMLTEKRKLFFWDITTNKLVIEIDSQSLKACPEEYEKIKENHSLFNWVNITKNLILNSSDYSIKRDYRFNALVQEANNTVLLSDSTKHKSFTLRGHTGRVTSTTFSRNGQFFASGGADKTLKVWRLFNDAKEPDPRLVWTSTPLLNADGAVIEDVIELSASNLALLKQRGAIHKGDPIND